MEISANLSDTTRILANGWIRPDKPEPVEATDGEKVLVRHAQGSAGPDGPVSQAQSQTEPKQLARHAQGSAGPDGPVSQTQSQTEPKQLEKRVQGSAEPEQTANTSRVYSRNRSLRAIRQRLAMFSWRV